MIDFDRAVADHSRELRAHCYRILGSTQDAEDALQETLVAAWRGLESFEGRSSVRTWLFRIATRAALRIAERRPPRMLSWDHGPARSPADELGEPILEPIWVEPLPTDPAEAIEQHDSVRLAWIAALQQLPPNQRAVLVLREVLAFSAVETADLLGTSVASVNSALQRARATVDPAMPSRPPTSSDRRVADAFMAAWQAADVDGLVALLADDVRFTMPPLPAWFDGVADVRWFVEARLLAQPWRLVPMSLNGLPGFAGYQWNGSEFALAGVNALEVRDGQVTWVASFLEPGLLALLVPEPENFPPDR